MLRIGLPAFPVESCPVVVGNGALGRLREDLVRRRPPGLIAVISDGRVARSYGVALAGELKSAGFRAVLIRFPAGEVHKTRETKSCIEDRLARHSAGRDATIIALGGGVTCDLAGFVAATWNRGIDLFHAPTSLVAMVDAAIGGKTAVDLPAAKNAIGAFHRPRGVYADLGLLATLPARDFRGGFAEIVKAAVIADRTLFDLLERDATRLLSRNLIALEPAIIRAIRVKARLVEADERDAGARAMLNFGHTIGHALEVVSGYRLDHGSAVSIGMAVEARLAQEATGFPAAAVSRLLGLLDLFGLPRRVPPGVDANELVRATRVDKKSRGGRARYALPRSLGCMPFGADPTVPVAERRVVELLRSAGAR